MSIFIARSALTIFRDLIAKVAALLGDLNIDEGGPETVILGAVAEEMALHEARLAALVRAHGLDAEGTDLDNVTGQIMSALGVRRGQPTFAVGEGLRLVRSSSVGSLAVPAGSVFFREDDRRLQYVTTVERTFANGQTVYPGVGDDPLIVRCLVAGSIGNARVGAITGIENAPSGIVEVTNTQVIGGGLDVERDDSLRTRAKHLLASIAKSQPKALQFLAGRWPASEDGAAILHASVFEDPEFPGLSELLVDDGNGLPNSTRAATTYAGVVPPTGGMYLPFDGPAATEPLLSVNGSVVTAASGWPGAVVLYERGRIEFTEGYGLTPGDTFTVGGHLVYTGAVAEIQNALEGDTFAANVTDYGWRACGTRVRVRPPLTADLPIQLRIEWAANVDPADGEDIVTEQVVGYVRSLGIGESFRPFDLYIELGKLKDVVKDAAVLSPTDKANPPTLRHRLTTSADLVTYATDAT